MNFKRVLSGIDVEPLMAQLREIPVAADDEECYPFDPLPVRWRKRTEWTANKDPQQNAIYNEHNIVLRYTTLGLEDRTGKLFLWEGTRDRSNWTRPAGKVLTAAWPIVEAMFCAVHAEHIGMVILTRLRPGEAIKEHIDHVAPIPGLPYWQRYQVPLQADDVVTFRCGGEGLQMEPGCGYWFNARDRHSVENRSQRDRYTLIVELRPMFP